MKRFIVVSLLALFFPVLTFAATLADLQAQVQALQSQIQQLQSGEVLGASTTCPTLYRNLSYGMRGTDVRELQQFLITQKYLTAGYDTGYFLGRTQTAVRNFQCATMNLCSGDPRSTGYGQVGPTTRAKIASICAAPTPLPTPTPTPVPPPPPTTPPPAPPAPPPPPVIPPPTPPPPPAPTPPPTYVPECTAQPFAVTPGGSVFAPSYWPQPAPGSNLVLDYFAFWPPVATSSASQTRYISQHAQYRADTTNAAYLLAEFDPQFAWLSTWDYRISEKGVEEYADQVGSYYVNKGYPPNTRYVQPIFWGKTLVAGQTVGAQIEVDAAFLGRPKEPQDWGWHDLTLLSVTPQCRIGNEVYTNVAAIRESQSFCADAACSKSNAVNAIYYMAPGLGFIQIDFYDTNWNLFNAFYLDRYCYGPDTQYSCPK